MATCGMCEFSGEYAYSIGLPAKSGVSGCVMIVVPNVGGFVTFSPRLDQYRNSVRGIEFSKQLVKRFKFHPYDIMNTAAASQKRDPCSSATGLFPPPLPTTNHCNNPPPRTN